MINVKQIYIDPGKLRRFVLLKKQISKNINMYDFLGLSKNDPVYVVHTLAGVNWSRASFFKLPSRFPIDEIEKFETGDYAVIMVYTSYCSMWKNTKNLFIEDLK